MATAVSPAPPSPELGDADERSHEVFVRAHRVEVHAGPPGECGQLSLALFRGGPQPRSELRIARVDEDLLAGLGVLDVHEPGIGQLELTRVGDLQGDDLVAAGEPAERLLPPG